MSGSDEQNRWLSRVLEQLRAIDGVTCEATSDGRIALEISHEDATRKLSMAGTASDYRALKIQYGRLRKALTALGIEEGQKFVAARRSQRAISPEMLAASAQRRQAFEAWQELWRTIREAEKSLDVEFEIIQMRDYY